jgi:hypothetical protein
MLLHLCCFTLGGCDKKNTNRESNSSNEVNLNRLSGDTIQVKPGKQLANLSDLFHFHRQFSVNDTLTFDILAWGPSHSGTYLILKTDRLSDRYTAISGDRVGHLSHCYITDMDADKQEEVLIIMKQEPEGKGSLVIHEIDSLNKQKIISLPKLAENLSEGYIGSDTIYMRGKKIIREFPVYEVQNKVNTIKGKRSIEYIFSNNTLVLSGNTEVIK